MALDGWGIRTVGGGCPVPTVEKPCGHQRLTHFDPMGSRTMTGSEGFSTQKNDAKTVGDWGHRQKAE